MSEEHPDIRLRPEHQALANKQFSQDKTLHWDFCQSLRLATWIFQRSLLMSNWMDSFLRSAKRDELLSWALQSGKIRLANAQQFAPEEQMTLVLAAQAARHNHNLIIHSPFPNANLAIAATSGVLLTDFVLRQKGAGLLRGDVLLVTRQIGIGTSELRGLSFANINLSEIWQVESVTQVVKVRGRGRPRVLVAPPQPQKINEADLRVDTIILDATHPLTLDRLDEILETSLAQQARRKVIILPVGYQPDFVDDEWVVWTWDLESVGQSRAMFENAPCDWEEQWHRTFLVCHDNRTDLLLSQARKKLSLLSRYAGSVPPISLQWAWVIYNRLTSLSVPLGIFEDTAYRHPFARTVRQRLEYIGEQDISDIPHESRAIWASEWRPLVDSLQETYRNLKGDHPAKFWAIAYLLDERIQTGFSKPLLLICPTQIEGNLLVRELRRVVGEIHMHLHPKGFMVVTPRYLAELTRRWDYEVVIPGRLLSRWRYLNHVIQESSMIAYPHEVDVEQANLNYGKRILQETSSPTARLSVLSTLRLSDSVDVSRTQVQQDINEKYTVIDVDGIPERRIYQDEQSQTDTLISPSWVWDVEELTSDLNTPPSRLFPAEGYGTNGMLYDGPRVELSLSNGETWVVPGDQVFDVFRMVTEELQELPATSLQVGDILLLIEDENYNRLFDRIVEALEQHPNFTLLGVWLNLWEIVKQSALERFENDFSILHAELEKQGIVISEQAVRSWFRGIMGPRENEGVFTIIELSQFQAAIENKSKIRLALGHVRGMRRAAGRRIRQLIRQTASGEEVPTNFTDVVDLAVEDVLSASTRVVVQEIEIFSD